MGYYKNWDDKKLYTTFVELGEEIEKLHDEYFELLQRLLKDDDRFMFTDSIDYGNLKDTHRELLYKLNFKREMSFETSKRKLEKAFTPRLESMLSSSLEEIKKIGDEED
ncbi:MAG: hypothetical protein HN514_05925 [Candidatus Marinimicrobia bacterium]|jgi:hypothetical protein|nr:hypothetical protein [Candidatus Neomarinimicrobiota bacterium]MBT6402167.1 hypothetical protein [Candidatus Woesearchaeota archaeon]